MHIMSVQVRWGLACVGLWLAVSPWVLGFSSISVMKWNNIAIGVGIILVNMWSIFGKDGEAIQETDKKEGARGADS